MYKLTAHRKQGSFGMVRSKKAQLTAPFANNTDTSRRTIIVQKNSVQVAFCKTKEN
jgi:hypothetical protein